MSYDKAAFFEVCATAKPAESAYVSLYVELPYYGGPEEGGWWGSDTELVAYQQVSNEVEAKALVDQVKALADKLSQEAKDRFYQDCATSVEWVEQHDPMADVNDYFPEPDGEEKYWVTTESRPGEHVRQGSRYYE